MQKPRYEMKHTEAIWLLNEGDDVLASPRTSKFDGELY